MAEVNSRIVEEQAQQFLIFARTGYAELQLVMAEEDFDGAIAHANWSMNHARGAGDLNTKYYVLNTRSGIWYEPIGENEHEKH